MIPNSPNALLSLLLTLQLVGFLVFVLAGLYVLYCFNRAASGVERMADAAEAWLALQQYQVARAGEKADVDESVVEIVKTVAPVTEETRPESV